MGVEVVQSNLSVDGVGKVDIKFGCYGADEPPTGDLNKLYDSNLPKDAAAEWPEPAQIHSFYIVKYRPLEDENLKAKLDVAQRELLKNDVY
ncbi:hypothetical protein CASFOL_018327 [Castilleja foliolosa]|uniref:Uncharacterized protein n=1 Tax=Castilleja foliolosa TaxID=1961234 RepID=A0ABD3D9I0_9LAMI